MGQAITTPLFDVPGTPWVNGTFLPAPGSGRLHRPSSRRGEFPASRGILLSGGPDRLGVNEVNQ